MIRDEEYQSSEGQMAFQFYNVWMQEKGRSVLNPDSFKSSRYFNAFYRFAKLVKKAKTPRPKTFIWLMVHRDYQPSMWVMPEVYGEYLEYLDHTFDPDARVIDTIKTFDAISKEHGCKRNEIFDKITVPELIHFLTRKEMSPWLLLHCEGFKRFLHQCNPSDLEHINAMIQVKQWKKRFTQNQERVDHYREFAKRLNL